MRCDPSEVVEDIGLASLRIRASAGAPVVCTAVQIMLADSDAANIDELAAAVAHTRSLTAISN